jgi:hypothetical protein
MPCFMPSILLLQAKDDSSFESEGAFSSPVPIDSSAFEHELRNLQPATSYVVLVKLYNEAGAAEEKLRITTSTEKIGRKPTIHTCAVLFTRLLFVFQAVSQRR